MNFRVRVARFYYDGVKESLEEVDLLHGSSGAWQRPPRVGMIAIPVLQMLSDGGVDGDMRFGRIFDEKGWATNPLSAYSSNTG